MNDHRRAAGLHALASRKDPARTRARDDVLSQVLGLIRLRSERVYTAELAAPWALRFERGSACFHVVIEGAARIEAPDGRVVEARRGDLVVLPQGSGHVIGTRGAGPTPARDLLAAQLWPESLAIRVRGRGETTRLISGSFRFEGDNLPAMLAALPSTVHVAQSVHPEDARWLADLAHEMHAESRCQHPGAATLVSRLLDVLVIHAMRLWVRDGSPEEGGWLGALADPRISRVLSAVHAQPFRDWTVASLASIAGMSRSSFAERFTTLIGAPPLQYQTRWRLLLARELLERPDARVTEVARRVGYASDAAFSRAFKSQFGMAPGAVTRGR